MGFFNIVNDSTLNLDSNLVSIVYFYERHIILSMFPAECFESGILNVFDLLCSISDPFPAPATSL